MARPGVAAQRDARRAAQTGDRRLERAFDSTRVHRGWFDPESQTIQVEFVDGVHWIYFQCDRRTWDAFVASRSPGRFVHDVLDQHPYRAR